MSEWARDSFSVAAIQNEKKTHAKHSPKARTESLKDSNFNEDTRLEQPRRLSTPDVVDSVTRTFNGVIPPMRRSTSCGDEMMTRGARTARSTGRNYLIRECKDGDNLLANLMNLRNIMLGQQSQQVWGAATVCAFYFVVVVQIART